MSESTTRKRRRPEEARALILDAARKIIVERGPDRTGLKDIAREAGISHSLITHYFGSIDSVIETVLEQELIGLRERIIDSIKGQIPIAELIGNVLKELSEPMCGRLMAWAFLSGRTSSAEFFPRKNQGMRQIADHALNRIGVSEEQRAELELRLMMVSCAAIGYAAAGELLWNGLGHQPSSERDELFRDFLTTAGTPSPPPSV